LTLKYNICRPMYLWDSFATSWSFSAYTFLTKSHSFPCAKWDCRLRGKWVMMWLLGQTMRLVNLVAANDDEDSAANINIWIEPANCSISLPYLPPPHSHLHSHFPDGIRGRGRPPGERSSGRFVCLVVVAGGVDDDYGHSSSGFCLLGKVGKWNFYRTAIALALFGHKFGRALHKVILGIIWEVCAKCEVYHFKWRG